jgi:membrane dipeptidase
MDQVAVRAESDLYRRTIVWDAHSCMPIQPNQDLSRLERHRQAGATFVSLNVGMDFNPLAQCIRVIAGYRDWLRRHADRFVLAETTEDVRRAKIEGKLAVAFDLEGSVMLEDDLAMLGLFRDVGVRQIHLAYNLNNSIAAGCHDEDRGLTALGRAVVAEINRVGMLMDCSHSGRKTSLEIMEISEKPVIFSHANPKALRNHGRNIDDTQIDACAKTDGVIGICGIGPFLGENDIRTETILRHIDYVAERVGTRHIGLGLDYVFHPEVDDLPAGEPAEKWWPRKYGYGSSHGPMKIVPPEQLPEIADALVKRGLKEDEIIGIMGGNFLRAAEATWAKA